jgi:hypothetical protein
MAILGKRNDARGKFRDGTRYATRGTVHSGDGDTTFMDAVDAIIPVERFAAVSYHADRGVVPDLTGEAALPTGRAANILVTGDGVVLRIARRQWVAGGGLAGLVATYARMGFELDASEVESPVQLSFCSSTWWPTSGTCAVMGPLPGKVLAKNMWHLDDVGAAASTAWLRVVVAGMCQRVAHVPFLRVVYANYAVALGCDARDLEEARRVSEPWKALPDKAHDAGDWAIMAAMDRYAMSRQAVVELESWLDDNTRYGTPGLLEHPALAHIADVDI